MTELQTAPRLSDGELVQVLALTKDADSVELKVTIPEPHHRATTARLGIDPLEARMRQVCFFDTPHLALYSAGVVVRARRTQGKADDSVVKLRPVVPSELPADVRKSPNCQVEVDAMPGGFVCSASLKARIDQGRVKEVLAGERTVRKLFSKEQRSFFEAHAPAGSNLDDLTLLGPLLVLKLRFAPVDFDRKLVAELWLYPDGSRVLEISTKCAPDDAFQAAAEVRAYLDGRGVDLDGVQQTKTRKALEYFAHQLVEAG